MIVLTAFVGTACGGSGSVELALILPSGPVAGASVTVLPYDPYRILDSLARASATPQPTFPGLDAAIHAYAPEGDANDLGDVERVWRATRDSAIALADSLRAEGRHSPGYAAGYRRFRSLYDRLSARAADHDSALRARTAASRALAERAARDADSLRTWERVAYADYAHLAREALRRSARSAQTVVTDADGRVSVDLPRGDWWIVARIPDQENPFLEYRWDVGVRITGFPIRVPLSPLDAHREWRH